MKSSAESSPTSGTRATSGGEKGPIAACAAAVNELTATRVLTAALESENAALKARLEALRRETRLLDELNATRKAETAALRTALDAKNDTITAKDAVIASQDKLVETLRRKRSPIWKRALDIMIGVGVGAILK